MRAITWSTNIPARRKRALELKALQRVHGGLWLALAEENGRTWSLSFKAVQAWKIVAQESAGRLAAAFPEDGALFLVEDSPWLAELEGTPVLRHVRHYVLFCYDEVIEVAAGDCVVSLTTR